MGVYTTELRFICEYLANHETSQPQTKVSEIIETARTKIFDFEYPLFDPEHKKELETKILRHFYTREICCETVGLWKLYLEQKMTEIMPYYNQLYESAAKEYDPFNDVDYIKEGTVHDVGTKEETGESEDTTTGLSNISGSKENTGDQITGSTNTGTVTTEDNTTTEKESNSIDRYSDTPQGGLTGITSDTYLTNARIVDIAETDTVDGGSTRTDNLESNTTRTDNLKEESEITSTTSDNTNSNYKNDTDTTNDRTYSERVHGKMNSVSYSELIMKLRESFINIDMLIINDLEDLFMLVY